MKPHAEDATIAKGTIVSPKLDGIYARATKDGLFSKSGKEIKTQQHIIEALQPHFQKNPDSELKGELYKHGQSFDDTLSAFAGGKSKLQFHLFPTTDPKPDASEHIQHVKGTVINSKAQADAHFAKSVSSGYEGQVLHSPEGVQTKRKPWQDAEFKVTGAAKGKTHGILTVQDKDGASFKVQAPAAVAHEGSIGKQATISYVRKTDGGVPHAPVFKSVRDYEMSAQPQKIIRLSPALAHGIRKHYNTWKEVGQAEDVGAPTAQFASNGRVVEFAARLLMLQCTKVTQKAHSTREGKKWMKCARQPDGSIKKIHWGQACVKVTGKSGNTARKSSFKARHDCAHAKPGSPQAQACKDWV